MGWLGMTWLNYMTSDFLGVTLPVWLTVLPYCSSYTSVFVEGILLNSPLTSTLQRTIQQALGRSAERDLLRPLHCHGLEIWGIEVLANLQEYILTLPQEKNKTTTTLLLKAFTWCSAHIFKLCATQKRKLLLGNCSCTTVSSVFDFNEEEYNYRNGIV